MRGLIFLVAFISSCATSGEKLQSTHTTIGYDSGLVRVKSDFGVEKTTKRLVKILDNKGMTIFNKINHKKNAKNVGMELPPTRLVIFGNPKMGTKLMQCAPSVAIDLPMKFAVNKDSSNQVWITYNSPKYLATRHEITGCEKIIEKMTGALGKISAKAAMKDK